MGLSKDAIHFKRCKTFNYYDINIAECIRQMTTRGYIGEIQNDDEDDQVPLYVPPLKYDLDDGDWTQ